MWRLAGRQYPSLRALFTPWRIKWLFVIENGGGIYYQDKLIYSSAFDRDTAPAHRPLCPPFAQLRIFGGWGGESVAMPKKRRVCPAA